MSSQPQPRTPSPERDTRPAIVITFTLPAFCGPAFRAAVDEFRGGVAARLDSRNRTLKEDAITRALVGLQALGAATNAAIASEDPNYA